MIPSGSSHDSNQAQPQQHQQQEKEASQLFAKRAMQERRLKPPDQVIACPRCQSLNTKFCYYNNYSLTQPRHFCKGCRRYWTAGGTLRNVPVGGGCRKNKRTKPRTPEGSNSGAAGADNEGLSLPGLFHPGFSSTSVGFLSSNVGSPYGFAEPCVRGDSPVSQSSDGGQLVSFHPGQSSGLSRHHPHGFEDAQRVGALSSLGKGLGIFNLNPGAGRDQPTFVSLERWQASKQQQEQQQQQQQQQQQEQQRHHGSQGSVRGFEVTHQQAGVDMNRQDVNGKMTLSMVPAPGMNGRRLPTPSWQAGAPQEASPAALSHYEQPPEQNYWSSTWWPSMDPQAFQSSGGGQAL